MHNEVSVSDAILMQHSKGFSDAPPKHLPCSLCIVTILVESSTVGDFVPLMSKIHQVFDHIYLASTSPAA
uniref:Ovule protein n=1 Tax=Ascaris lumbricoides TaxID=6252 RepID=A0A0M3I4A0_ASCLU